MMSKPKRCFHFADDGTPTYPPCKRDSRGCGFAHPDEPCWNTLPPLAYHQRANARGAWATRTSPSRRGTSPRIPWAQRLERPRSPSPSYDDRNSSRYRNEESSRLRGNTNNSRERRPLSPVASYDKRDRSQYRSPEKSKVQADTDNHERPTIQRERSPPSTARSAHPSAPPVNHPGPSSKPHEPPQMPPQSEPLTPSVVAPIPPPPPLPVPPAFLQSDSNSSLGLRPAKAVLTTDQKRTIWIERIKLLAESVVSHIQYAKINEELTTFQRLAEASVYANSDKQSSLTEQATALKMRREEKRAEISTALARLVEKDYWPVSQHPDVDDAAETRYKEIIKYVEELKQTATEMSKVLNDFRGHPEPSEPPPTNTSTDVDMDDNRQEGPSSRPLKRRRSPTPSTSTHSRSIRDTHPVASSITPDYAEQIDERLAAIKTSLDEFTNHLNGHQRDLRDEFDARIEGEIERSQQTLKRQVKGKISKLKDDSALLDTQVEEISKTLGDLFLRSSQVNAEIERLTKQNEEFQSELPEMQRQLSEFEESTRASAARIQALEHALEIQRNAIPPPVTHLPPDIVLRQIEAPLLDSVRSHIQPLIEDLRAQIQDMVNTQNNEMFTNLWGKLSLTVQMVEAISARINSEDKFPGGVGNGRSSSDSRSL